MTSTLQEPFLELLMPIDCPDLEVEEALRWVSRYAQLQPSPIAVDPAQKWVIRSALQKAVRRGQADRAVDLSLRLHRIDPANAWRAIRTIAVEDVGIASPDVVRWSTAARLKDFRRTVGEIPLLIALVRRMATGLKSRSAIELAFVTDTGAPELIQWFGRMDQDGILRGVMSDTPAKVYAALSVLRGVVPPGLCIRETDLPGVHAAIAILAGRVPVDHLSAMRTALLHPLDNMSIGFAAISAFVPAAETVNFQQDIPPASEIIAGFCSEAYDQHERLGRTALSIFAKRLGSDTQLRDGLSSDAFKRAVSDAVFVEEGQCLDRWMMDRQLDELRDHADLLTVARHGLQPESVAALRLKVRDEVEMLNRIRRACVNA